MPSPRATKEARHRGLAPEMPRLLAGRHCLDFANTIERPIGSDSEDFLRSYADLVRWSWHAGAIETAEAERLRELGEADPAQADRAFADALRLRDAIQGVFRALAAGADPPEADLLALRDAYVEALGAAPLAPDGGRMGWGWRALVDPRRPTWAAVSSAIELLTGDDLSRVKQCPGATDCGWLFYDTSRNRTRRWCSMEGCGSRVKMRRHYARRRPASSGG